MNVSALRKIANPRLVARLVSGNVWPKRLAAPIFAADNDSLIRAVSLIHHMPTRDGEPVRACDLTPDQARDVVRRFDGVVS